MRRRGNVVVGGIVQRLTCVCCGKRVTCAVKVENPRLTADYMSEAAPHWRLTVTDPYDSADYYDAVDDEQPHHAHPHDAIDELVQQGDWDDEPCPIEVIAYVVEYDEAWLMRVAERAAESTVRRAPRRTGG